MREIYAFCVSFTQNTAQNSKNSAHSVMASLLLFVNLMRVELVAAGILFYATCAYGQGTTFLYDQQDSTYEASLAYGSGPTIQSLLPSTGQSFTPALSGIDFIRLKLQDNNASDGLGATINLYLRSTSITGPILGTTASVDMPNGFSGVQDFFFPSTIPLAPGTQYFFDLNLQSVGLWNVDFQGLKYSGGVGWEHGLPNVAGGNYWFREGIIVPEPSSFALFALGGCSLLWSKDRKKQEAS